MDDFQASPSLRLTIPPAIRSPPALLAPPCQSGGAVRCGLTPTETKRICAGLGKNRSKSMAWATDWQGFRQLRTPKGQCMCAGPEARGAPLRRPHVGKAQTRGFFGMSTSNRGSGSILCAARLIRWVIAECASIGEDPVGVKPHPLLPSIAASGLKASDLHRSEVAAGEGGPEMSQSQAPRPADVAVRRRNFGMLGGNPPRNCWRGFVRLCPIMSHIKEPAM